MNDKYKSKSVDQALAHLMEELAGAIQAAAESLRFGLSSDNPEILAAKQETNIVWLAREMTNVCKAYMELDELCKKFERRVEP